MPSKFFDKIDSSLPSYLEVFAGKSLDIIDQVNAILNRQGLTQKDLAAKLGKSESEISKWLSGGHNLTLKTISKIEDALGADVIVTPSKVNADLFDYFHLLEEGPTLHLLSSKEADHDGDFLDDEFELGHYHSDDEERFIPFRQTA